MARKTFIKIRRGILESKHRIKLGAAWQLYFYMLDLVNWETGMIFGWKDKDAACDLEMPVATLRDQRRRLEDELYISTTIKKYGLEVSFEPVEREISSLLSKINYMEDVVNFIKLGVKA